MPQLSLFADAPPPKPEARKLARRNGPETSAKAAREIGPELAAIQSWALSAVLSCPHKTATEACEELGIKDIRKLNRRLSELESMGLIRREPARKCSITGKSAHPWSVVKAWHGGL